MKKTYLEPSVMVINIKTTPLMNASDPLDVSGTTDQNLSRRHRNNWDDEEDYEEY